MDRWCNRGTNRGTKGSSWADLAKGLGMTPCGIDSDEHLSKLCTESRDLLRNLQHRLHPLHQHHRPVVQGMVKYSATWSTK